MGHASRDLNHGLISCRILVRDGSGLGSGRGTFAANLLSNDYSLNTHVMLISPSCMIT